MNTSKPFLQRKDGAIFSGLCNGIAAYTNVDVKYVRLWWLGMSVFIGAKVFSIYAVLMFVVPYANDETESTALLDAQIIESHIVRKNARGLLDYLAQSWNGALRRLGWNAPTRAQHE